MKLYAAGALALLYYYQEVAFLLLLIFFLSIAAALFFNQRFSCETISNNFINSFNEISERTALQMTSSLVLLERTVHLYNLSRYSCNTCTGNIFFLCTNRRTNKKRLRIKKKHFWKTASEIRHVLIGKIKRNRKEIHTLQHLICFRINKHPQDLDKRGSVFYFTYPTENDNNKNRMELHGTRERERREKRKIKEKQAIKVTKHSGIPFKENTLHKSLQVTSCKKDYRVFSKGSISNVINSFTSQLYSNVPIHQMIVVAFILQDENRR